MARREWIEEALSDYGETLLFVSHDRWFISRFATRVWAMGGGELRDYRMGYEEYREYLERQKQLAQTAAQKAEKPKKEPKKTPPAQAKSAARLEREIGQLEEKLAENERAQEAASTDYHRLMELSEKHGELAERLEELYRQWEEASV